MTLQAPQPGARRPTPLTDEQERDLARQAAVAALTAVGRLRSPAEAAPGSGTAAPAADDGHPAGGPNRQPLGFASPQRAVRRTVRGSWAQRG